MPGRPIGTFTGIAVGGGFDSRCIAALAAPIRQARGQRIVAVASVLSPATPGRDPRSLVEAYRNPGIDLHYLSAGPDDTPFDRLSTTFASSDASVATDYVRRGLYRMAQNARAAIVLDGMGGDYTLHRCTDAALGHVWRTGVFRSFCRAFAARRHVTGLSILRTLHDEVFRALQPSLLQLREWITPPPRYRKRKSPRRFRRGPFLQASHLINTCPKSSG